jgi:acyl-coenzyme A synthetase/AMP-(fatty) acid ligase
VGEHAAVPREVRFVDALPLGASGKVQKRELRAWLAEEGGTP